MKKTTEIMSSIITIGTLALSLVGCGSGNTADTQALTGSWSYTTSLSDILEHDMNAQDKELFEADTLNTVFFDTVGSDTIDVTYTFTFNENGTCSLTGNTDEVLENVDKLVEENQNVLAEKILAKDDITFSGSYGNDDSYTFADEEDMLNSYVADWKLSIKLDFISKYETGDGMNQTCNYTAKNSSLYISQNADTKVNEKSDSYGTYTFSDNTLEIQTNESTSDLKPATDWTYTKN